MVFKFTTSFILFLGLFCLASQALADTDPTRPFGHRATSPATSEGQQLVLESIIHGDGIHTVVINGQVLKTFDRIGEFQLTAVNDQSVILRSETQRLKLHVFKSNLVKIKAY